MFINCHISLGRTLYGVWTVRKECDVNILQEYDMWWFLRVIMMIYENDVVSDTSMWGQCAWL